MTTSFNCPDYPPVEADNQWCIALYDRIVAEAGSDGIPVEDCAKAFAKAYADAVRRGEVWRRGLSH